MSPLEYANHLANNILPNDSRYMSQPPISNSTNSFFNSNMFSSIIGGGLGILGNIFNNRAISKENQKNRDFAHNEAILAHERNLELTDKQNQWNSFENQRALLTKAGYNPYALFSNGGSIARGSSTTGSPQANSPSTGMPRSIMDPQMIQALSQAKLADAQARLLDSQKNLNDIQATEIPLNNAVERLLGKNQANYYKWQSQNQEYAYNWLYKTEGVRLSQLEASLQLTDEQSENFRATTSCALYNLNHLLPLQQQQLKKIINEVIPKQIDLLVEQQNMTKAQASQFTSNALYLMSLKAYQDKKNNDPKWFQAELDKMVADGNYLFARYWNELKGLPYLIQVGYNQSAGFKIGIDGVSGNLNIANGGVYNPAMSNQPFITY